MTVAQSGAGIAIVVPAFNEARSIAQVVKAFAPLGDVVVVDDGSSDGTAGLAEAAGATVFRQPTNKGYTAALAAGLGLAIKAGKQFAITADADGQHAPQYVAAAASILAKGADVAVGVRDRHQRISEVIFSVVGRLRWGIADPLCGIKGYRLGHLATLRTLDSYESVGTELVVRAAARRWKIDQFPVRTLPRQGKSTFGHGMRAEARIIRALWLGLLL